jgi:DNA-binding SARP family transcriptional activator
LISLGRVGIIGGRLVTNSSEAFSSDNPLDESETVHWQNTLNLLKLMQNDYQGVRKQIELVSQQLAEREALVSQHLQHAFLSSQNLHTLCLVDYKIGNTVNRMGNIILGGVTRPNEIPPLSRIEVCCLGRFEVRTALRKVEHWHSVKAKSIFQYLLTRPRETTGKETLMETLWPDCNPQAAANNLKAAIHNLRITLNSLLCEGENPQYVLFLQGGYRINPEVNLWVDVEEFEKCWVSGRHLEKEHKMTEAIFEYEKAEALYSGDYLEDEPYEEWTLLRRETLKDTYLIILSKLADGCMASGDYESCIHYSQKILAKDRCREDAYRRLMCCYYKLGQRNRSLRWYEIGNQTIRTELDTQPDNDTVELYNRILREEEI